MPTYDGWPALPYEPWADTVATLHLWTQVVGKVRLQCAPWVNHSWHVVLYVTPTGLTTSTLCHGDRQFDLEFDFFADRLRIRTGEGERRELVLEPRTVASFHDELLSTLDDMGLGVEIDGMPNELPDPIPFAEDTTHSSYDGDAARRFARALNLSAKVMHEFRARFLGKVSPVHFFWGSFDLAVTRFSGREAPPHPGGFPHLADWVTREAYSHEVYSCGFWPGGESSPAPAYYAYAYPVPDGLAGTKVGPEGAFWSDEMGEWFLPYDVVRNAADPGATLMQFLQESYEAVAGRADWDRDKLEVPEGFPRHLA